MTPTRKHNILISPIVIFVRIPILFPFWLMAKMGEKAQSAGEWLGGRLPGFKREPRTHWFSVDRKG